MVSTELLLAIKEERVRSRENGNIKDGPLFFEGGGQFPKTKHSRTAKMAAMGKNIEQVLFLTL